MPVSVIIPTLNEAACLPETVRMIRAQKPLEIIVSDGGSTDETRSCAGEADVYLDGQRGRARQMNAAAARAAGDVLLFLHADCTLEDGALHEAERILCQGNVVAGCFRMTVVATGRLYRLIAASASARVRLTGLAYGDQGLFLRRHSFERLGGFPALGFMEDLFFSRRLRQEGRIVVARSRIYASPRRWQRVGLVRQTLRNWALTGLVAGGLPPDRLAAYYPALR
jgi:rSAM/selenodomain-associated transferase 2